MEKKYELLTDQTIQVDGRTLYRIRALRDVGMVKAGSIGGYVESEDNLSHFDDCWIYKNAKVYGGARITKSAEVRGAAQVYERAMVSDHANVSGKARVYGSAAVFGEARVAGICFLFGAAHIYCDAVLKTTSDYLTIGPIGSEEGVLTAWRDSLWGVMVNRGCFIGTLREFENEVKALHADNIHGIMYGHAIAMIKAALA